MKIGSALESSTPNITTKRPPRSQGFVRSLLVVVSGVWLAATTANAGTISGRVHAEGKPGAESGAAGGNYDSHALKNAVKVDYAELKDFVVYIEGPVGTNAPVAPEKPLQVVTAKPAATTNMIRQQKAMFTPHVLPVLVGTTVEWPNKDDIYHNVFSYSDAKPFDLGLYKGSEPKPVPFDRVGRVDVFCSIHANMHCIILVLENPYFASTDSRGDYVISNIPAGKYKLKAWHERLPAQIQEITVPENGTVKMDFTLGITNLPQY